MPGDRVVVMHYKTIAHSNPVSVPKRWRWVLVFQILLYGEEKTYPAVWNLQAPSTFAVSMIFPEH